MDRLLYILEDKEQSKRWTQRKSVGGSVHKTKASWYSLQTKTKISLKGATNNGNKTEWSPIQPTII